MKEYLKKLPKEVQDLISRAQDLTSCNNMPAYLVGGFVRDLILGVKNLDLDIVVEGDGIKFAETLATILKASLIRHRQFGTATVILKSKLKVDPSTSLRVNGERPSTSLRTALSERSESNGRSRTIDIATARKEYYPQPAHLPLVTPGSLKDDLRRRDFTINAMAISISPRDYGRLIDFFEGKSDLCHKKIRILHSLSFIDDPTRILRAIRFEKRYNFRIEPKTLVYLKEAVKLGMLNRVQPQRLRDELILVLKEECPLKSIRRTQELAGFAFIQKHLSVSKKTYVLLQSLKNQITWFKKVYPQRRQIDTWLIYFMGLIDGLNINRAGAVCDKFAFRKGEKKRILSYKKISRKFISDLSQVNLAPPKIFRLLEPLSYEVIILLKAKYKNRHIQRYIKNFFGIYHGMHIHTSGDDLHRLGLQPGPRYQKIFTQVLNAKLNGRLKTKEEELALIKKLVRTSRRYVGICPNLPHTQIRGSDSSK